MSDSQTVARYNERMKFLLKEIGFILLDNPSATSREEIYLEAENHAVNSPVIKVGELVKLSPSSTDNSWLIPEPKPCIISIAPGRYKTLEVEGEWTKAWAFIVEKKWEHVSIFYSLLTRDCENTVEEELRTLYRTVNLYKEQLTYPDYLGVKEKVRSEEERLAKNRIALPYMLAGDSVETTNTLLAHKEKANSAIAACLRAGVIIAEQIEEYQAYPKDWLNQLHPELTINSHFFV